jgi:hypothetical protein
VRQLPCNSQLDTALRDERPSALMRIVIVFYEHTYWDAYYVVVTYTVKIIKMSGGSNNTARPQRMGGQTVEYGDSEGRLVWKDAKNRL